MSWGIKIAALYIAFAGMIVFLVFRTSRENIDLVTDDYYQQELQYQDRIDQNTAANKLGAQPVVRISDGQVEIIFPDSVVKQGISGQAVFYRPSDASKDLVIELNTDSEGVQAVDLARFITGSYQLKLNWVSDGQPYYFETQLYIP
jgi:hypothetical protein